LNLESAIDRPDDVRETLIAAHRGLSDAQSLALNSRPIPVLANQIGSAQLIQGAGCSRTACPDWALTSRDREANNSSPLRPSTQRPASRR
jgi:hypothetical protein